MGLWRKIKQRHLFPPLSLIFAVKGGRILAVARQLLSRWPIFLTILEPNKWIPPANGIKNQVSTRAIKHAELIWLFWMLQGVMGFVNDTVSVKSKSLCLHPVLGKYQVLIPMHGPILWYLTKEIWSDFQWSPNIVIKTVKQSLLKCFWLTASL